ncbi:MAG TPA: histidine kinase [Povalibacter sp.]|uniref:sensor histidine kinase n=1 Tax=Povalibacter sp. TaxID=1962978 RepID=UPI002C84C1A0|nr:histidine kinase [Povalibacter sp.]HMN45650.1 histidine kinase [Povalibacter sp.]
MTVREATGNAALFSLWGLFWLTMLVVALQDASLSHTIRWWEPLLWEGSSALIATVWLIAQRRVDERYAVYLDRPWLWLAQHLKWLPLIVPTFIASIYLIRHGVYTLVGRSYNHEPWLFVVPYETAKLVLFAGMWLGIVFGFDSFAQWRTQRERLLSVQKALAESQLQQLQSQLRPHFLFNALNTISSLMHSDPERADRLLVRLSDLLRISLSMHRSELTSLAEELRVLDLYALIMRERFDDRVDLRWNVAEETLFASVPSLLLQPLLENAFKHGVERSQSTVVVRITASRDGDWLLMSIANTGTLDFTNTTGGIGLRNCRERLHVDYGPDATLELRQNDADVIARVRLPWREHQA